MVANPHVVRIRLSFHKNGNSTTKISESKAFCSYYFSAPIDFISAIKSIKSTSTEPSAGLDADEAGVEVTVDFAVIEAAKVSSRGFFAC